MEMAMDAYELPKLIPTTGTMLVSSILVLEIPFGICGVVAISQNVKKL